MTILARLLAVAGCLLAALPALAQDAKPEIDFVTRAANSDMTAVAASRLALDRSGDPQVKAFAQRLLDEHGKTEPELQAAAQGSGAAVPSALDESHQARVAALQGKPAADFDKAYIADQAEVHSNALTLYADYMLLGANARLKAYAVKMIPVTEAQFKTAQKLLGQ